MNAPLRPLLHITPADEDASVQKHGLLSSKYLLHNKDKLGDLFERIAKRRSMSSEEFAKQIHERMGSERWGHIFEGPNTFIDLPPDLTRLSTKHPLRSGDPTTTYHVDIDRLLKEIPETRLYGIELSPYDEKSETPRKRWIERDELAALQQRGASDLWKDYADAEDLGKYAPNVPHLCVCGDAFRSHSSLLSKGSQNCDPTHENSHTALAGTL